MKKILRILPVILLFMIQPAFGRALFNTDEFRHSAGKVAAGEPYASIGVHKVGLIALTVSNQGHFGTGFVSHPEDPLFGGPAPSCTYPYPSQKSYLFAGSFWIGAVVGRDTLVSVGADGWHDTREMWPDPYPVGAIKYHSLSNPEDVEAISEQDYIAVYTDTVTNPSYVAQDPFDNRPHKPLGVEVTQRSYAWSYSYADDFVLFDYSIKNIGTRQLENVYMGFYVDGDVAVEGSQEGYNDDVTGFRREIDSPQGCGFKDTINIAYIADNDGRESVSYPCLGSGQFPENSLTGVTGVRVIRTPADSLKYSFNWWISNGSAPQDFGPRRQGTLDDPFRDFGGNLGTPEGDLNKYYIMRHEEFDYDQYYSAVDQTDLGWLPPGPDGYEFADGFDTRYLLSFGPFDIMPGEVLPISFAYVGGENFHTDCYAFSNLFNAADPDPFYNQLSFDEFGQNALWAAWIYDNPGVDTDGNGYRGPSRFCYYDSVETCDTISLDSIICDWTYTSADTFYYRGDDVPDFVGASPPPPPELWAVDTSGDTVRTKVYPSITEFNQGELRIQWNGFRTETERDRFSNEFDFEGYRIYVSLSPTPSGFSVVASYDIEDYNRYEWDAYTFRWKLTNIPFSPDSLKTLYGNDFDPNDHDTPERMFRWEGKLYYFTSEDQNNSSMDDPEGIHKVYPDELPPTTLVIDSARLFYPEELTDDGLFFKYYEYEYVMKRLLPSQLYYVAVTAFDFGSPKSELEALETPPYRNYVAEYAMNDNSTVMEKNLDVVVYPNPYRIDGDYRETGFEGRDYIGGINGGRLVQQEFRPDERTRSIHFINLPPRCTIKIFTIDGDLVREINHDYPPDSPRSMHERWDMISRNTQMVVSGIYYYTVESDRGTQIGKIVIIL